MKECAVVVVTYNRVEMLKENLYALLNQTYKDFDILVIDNASTDSTHEMVSSIGEARIKYCNTGKNLGGAGGFSVGVKLAVEGQYKYAWLMDDDAIPDRNALESLIYKAGVLNDNFSFLCSLVYWKDGNIYPMNFPMMHYEKINTTSFEIINKWHMLLAREASFVGCFVNLEIVKQVGLPIAEIFIYGDDIEFTHRLRSQKPGYIDLDSGILHKTQSIDAADPVTMDINRIDRIYYLTRNGILNAKKDSRIMKYLLHVGNVAMHILKHAPNHKFKRLQKGVAGLIAGLFFSPDIHFPEDV